MLEGRMKLSINRAKTRTVRLTAEPKAAGLDFLGYTFRYDRGLYGGGRYLNLFPSKKSQQRARDRLRELTGPRWCFMPVVGMIARVNEHLRGWGTYFRLGYPRVAYRRINDFVGQRLTRHLRRRSQRPFRPPAGMSWYGQLHRLGLIKL